LPLSKFIQLLIVTISINSTPLHIQCTILISEQRKESTAKSNSSVLMDFTEKGFLYIHEAQGCHCTSTNVALFIQCFVISRVKKMSLCMAFPVWRNADIVMVYFIQKSITASLKTKIKDFWNVEYFTD